MRIATLIISLVTMVIMGIQSLVIFVAASAVSSLSEDASADKQNADNSAGGGAAGVFASLLWLIAAALVIAKPKAAMWTFIGSAVVCLIGATAGQFSDLYIWTVASVLYALMSWRGIRELAKKQEQERAAYQADLAVAAQAIAAPSQ